MTAECCERVHVIGIDDGGPRSLPAADREAIAAAELLCGGARHLRLFPENGAERFCIKNNISELIAKLRESLGRRRAVVLASGDPCFYGIGPILAEALGHERVAIEPRPSSVALAFSRLGLAWQDATVLSVHGRPIEPAVQRALQAKTIAVLTDREHTPAVLAQALLDAGMEDCTAYVCERLGGAQEHIHALGLAELPSRSFDPLNLLVLLRTSEPTGGAFGRDESEYELARGQITKAEVRAVTIARLEPWRASIAWDIGAGSGSVAVELAGLMPAGAVYALERDPEQLELVRRNARRHAAANVRTVAGSAPGALAALPEPDAIFIGGSGDELADILVVAAARLRAGGRLVANFARLESLGVWQQFAAELGWPRDLVQLSVARGAAIGAGTRLAALNPVFITRLTRPVAGDVPGIRRAEGGV